MAVAFDGVNQSFSKPSALFSGTSGTDFDITFVCWARPDDRHTGYIIAADNGSNFADGWGIYTVSGGKFSIRWESSYAIGTTTFPNGNTTWYHVAGVWQYGARTLYLDGASEATDPSDREMVLDNADNFYIGNSRLNYHFEGKIAECAAYSVSLTAAEIAVLAAGFSPLFVRPDKLVGYWPLGGPYAPDNTDIVGGNTLTINNSPAAETHPRIIYPTLPLAIMAASQSRVASIMLQHNQYAGGVI